MSSQSINVFSINQCLLNQSMSSRSNNVFSINQCLLDQSMSSQSINVFSINQCLLNQSMSSLSIDVFYWTDHIKFITKGGWNSETKVTHPKETSGAKLLQGLTTVEEKTLEYVQTSKNCNTFTLIKTKIFSSTNKRAKRKIWMNKTRQIICKNSSHCLMR